MIVAYGDYNSDQFQDIFYLSSDQRSLFIYTWNRSKYTFIEFVPARIRTESDFIITNVVPGDWNYDGRLDVLVYGQDDPGEWYGEKKTKMKVFLQQADGSLGKDEKAEETDLIKMLTLCYEQLKDLLLTLLD